MNRDSKYRGCIIVNPNALAGYCEEGFKWLETFAKLGVGFYRAALSYHDSAEILNEVSGHGEYEHVFPQLHGLRIESYLAASALQGNDFEIPRLPKKQVEDGVLLRYVGSLAKNIKANAEDARDVRELFFEVCSLGHIIGEREEFLTLSAAIKSVRREFNGFNGMRHSSLN